MKYEIKPIEYSDSEYGLGETIEVVEAAETVALGRCRDLAGGFYFGVALVSVDGSVDVGDGWTDEKAAMEWLSTPE